MPQESCNLHYDYVHDYTVDISSNLNNIEYNTVTIVNNIAHDKYYADNTP